MIENKLFADMINSPVRAFMGRVEFYNGSTLALLCGCHDNLKSFSIERVGDNKFFGYGICQKLNVKLIDRERAINITTDNTVEIEFGKDSSYIYPCPNFYVTRVIRDENTNELSITAYDALYNAGKHSVEELGLVDNYTLTELAAACGAVLGLPLNEVDSSFNLLYAANASFDGTETIRDVLNAIAEATQTIYFVNWDWKLTFKKLDRDGAAALTIDKEKYFSLDSGANRRLAAITHATELGDNVTASLAASGTNQYLRNNPLLELREDIGAILESGLERVGGLTINQFACSWRGNFLLEIGDKIELVTKDNKLVYSYLLNDTLTFDGALSQKSEWKYEEEELETASNPTSLGEALNLTFARVDKANKKIDLVASEATANSEAITNLQLSTDGISASVTKLGETTSDAFSSVNEGIATLTSQVEAKMSAEDVTLSIQTALESGVDKVVTSTGFTFNEEGLTVSKSGSEMETTITENGMIVYKDNEAVLTANNLGVEAVNLNASTFLIVGANSRFENYGSNRTGCFWIGG